VTYVHYEHDALVCGVGDCSLVQTSAYATLAGIPIAVLGLAMYATILGLSLVRSVIARWYEPVTAILFSLSLAGLLYAIYLTYVEIWVIDAICQWCVLSALITAAIFAAESMALLGNEPQEMQ
jgi:uncharacterized membrane protein